MFEVGNRVRCIESYIYAKEGERGLVIDIEDSRLLYLIEWDNDVSGHSGDGKGKYGYCEWVSDDNIELIDESIGQIRTISNSLDGFCDCMITHNDMSGTCILMHDKKKFEELSESQEMSYRYYDTTDEEELLYKEASFVISGTKVMYLYKYKKEEVE